jgi:hypothetical protein
MVFLMPSGGPRCDVPWRQRYWRFPAPARSSGSTIEIGRTPHFQNQAEFHAIRVEKTIGDAIRAEMEDRVLVIGRTGAPSAGTRCANRPGCSVTAKVRLQTLLLELRVFDSTADQPTAIRSILDQSS